MNGHLLKSRLLAIEPNLAEMARKLSISRQSLYQALEADDVKSGLIERIASLYNRPVGFFFDDCLRDINSISDAKTQIAILQERIKSLEAQINEKDARIAELTKMNNYLMEHMEHR